MRRALRALIETQADMMVVAEADSSSAALEYANALHPSVIVLDLMLPTTQAGLATVALLIQHEQACVATSWQSNLCDVALQMGAHAFVEKGTSPEHVLGAIRSTMQEPAKTQLSASLPTECARLSPGGGI